MGHSPLGAINLTTAADRRRKAALSKGQLVRTLLLFVLCVIAVTVAARQSRAAQRGVSGFVEDPWPRSDNCGVSQTAFGDRIADAGPLRARWPMTER